MASWMLDEPDKLTFDQVDRVLVRIVEGAVRVVGSDDRPTLEVSELAGAPLQVRHQGGDLVPGPDRLGRGRPRPPGLRRPRHPPVQRLGRPHRAPARGQRPRGQAPVDQRPGGQRLRAAGARAHPGPARGQGPARAGGGRLKASSTSGHVALLRRAPEATF